MTILEKIIRHKRKELVAIIEQTTVKDLEGCNLFSRKTIPLTGSILNHLKTGIIAEFKRKSPSRGVINAEAKIEEVTTGYFHSGASGLSILTDYEFFGGTTADLSGIRDLNKIPILRKDFIIDEYQIIESKAMGSDAILLIATALDKNQVLQLSRLARSLDLQVLLEIHNARELEFINEHVNIIGVNNRDLNTFKVDTELSVRLADKIPSEFLKISESGISSVQTIRKLKDAGYQGFLIGENFMLKSDPVTAFSDFVKLIHLDYDKG
jgi:indole-3-glycerol phosphate synthase